MKLLSSLLKILWWCSLLGTRATITAAFVVPVTGRYGDGNAAAAIHYPKYKQYYDSSVLCWAETTTKTETTGSSSNKSKNNNNDDYDNDESLSSSSLSSSTSSVLLPETLPLPEHTFAGLVEKHMIEKFGGEKNIERVLKSWRLLESGYTHQEYKGPNNIQPDNSNCHQYAHSYVPGLSVIEYWDQYNKKIFPWVKKLEKKYKSIYDEFVQVTNNKDKLQNEGNNIWAGALTNDAESYGVGWKTLVLKDRCCWDEINVNLFPITSKIVKDIPAVEIFFASMEPNSNIKLHSDFTNFVLTCHLPIIIPKNGDCYITIGDTSKSWINGNVMIFDTSIMHSAINDTNETRYILMMRIWHPDLTDIEKQALQYTYHALDYPNILSDDPILKQQAEEIVQRMITFPTIKRGQGQKSGFGGGSGGGSSTTTNNKKKNNNKKKGGR